MELLIGLAVLAVFIMMLLKIIRSFKSVGSAVVSRPAAAPPQRSKPRAVADWLELEVSRVLDGRLTGGDEPWRQDPATERQLERLEENGLRLREGEPTKGEASDLIGLFEKPEPDQKKQLKFFGETLERDTQTHARALLHRLMSDPARRRQWEDRPPSAEVKRQAKFYGVKLITGGTEKDAGALIAEFEQEDANEQRVDEWCALQEIIEEATDRDVADDYDCKKATVAQTIKAVESLQKEGRRIEKIDIDQLFDRLKELNPAIYKG